MVSIVLQVWGGIFFLLNKIFFSLAERHEKKRPNTKSNWRIWSWIVFLLGIPAWMVIFAMERNWIATALEAGGIPSMVLGLIIAVRGKGKQPKWLHVIALVCVVIGICYSLYDLGGFTKMTQVYELGMTTGFLIGTYFLAHKNASGYLWYILMHVAAILLVYMEGYLWLAIQQIVSALFVIDAFVTKRKVRMQKAV